MSALMGRKLRRQLERAAPRQAQNLADMPDDLDEIPF